ncbi:uncharacterized protein NECHADRAFT_87871 [Fusarium vanettenii 77-13-4]|uniref:NADH:flavin oxidoreductase/NADH oxidase N-terminal domain-containing protein n=1 Tax=Fusarium vanettenii (strain ATCC MYA-4622 / CBS 123669 / FGSC 9596 / NRRL 45880 / 77-13-4) TaxID=660122 RepID=C7Z395_FUSV7|nr:uncharacterized protein NECHADRAFT_87871 [Fusarium vanettenii 77-13-4]EEU41617.1 hypothetical protein NECHADRAFT_87871 [Fusarium vanettenii 77-13-4]
MTPRRYPASPTDPSPLGKPLTFEFSGKAAKNRLLKAAMTERLSTWHPNNLEERGGEGGFGVILTGHIMIAYDQLEAAGNSVVSRDAPFFGERFEAFKEMASVTKQHGSLAVAQISHPGRQVGNLIQKNPISASDVQLEVEVMGMHFNKPKAMEENDFKNVVEGFAHAAEYLYKAGFDGIQLHGAHGYLLAQFLSPTTNKRRDKYGGSIENRSRLIFEIADAIRTRVTDPSFIIGIKVNSVEFQEGGFSTEDCEILCRNLEQHGFDFLELSGGTYQSLGFTYYRESSKKREAFFLDFADKIIPELSKTKAYVTGGLRTVKAMVDALDTVHGVGLGRPATHEFDLAAKILSGEANSAIDYLLDEQNFGVTNIASGAQIRLVGKDKQPLDLSREDHLKAFQDSMTQWGQGMTQNKDNFKFGFVDIQGVRLEPYGASYASA